MPKDGWWHHKIVELLAARRPVICYPGEHDEAKQLAENVGGDLHNPSSPESLADVLEKILREKTAPESPSPADLTQLSWDHQAAKLIDVLEGAAKR